MDFDDNEDPPRTSMFAAPQLQAGFWAPYAQAGAGLDQLRSSWDQWAAQPEHGPLTDRPSPEVRSPFFTPADRAENWIKRHVQPLILPDPSKKVADLADQQGLPEITQYHTATRMPYEPKSPVESQHIEDRRPLHWWSMPE
jgi:hypothetical protein